MTTEQEMQDVQERLTWDDEDDVAQLEGDDEHGKPCRWMTLTRKRAREWFHSNNHEFRQAHLNMTLCFKWTRVKTLCPFLDADGVLIKP